MRRLVPDKVILGLLAVQPAHGYELLEQFRSNKQLGRIWTMSTSQLYAVLSRLNEEGAITGTKLNPKDGPPRIQYTITKGGLSQVNAWLFDPHVSTSIHRIRVMFLSRLYIADKLEIPLSEIFANQISVCKAQCQKLSLNKQSSESWIENLTLDYVLNQLSALVKWMEKCKIQMT